MSGEALVWSRASLFLAVVAPKALSVHTCQINAYLVMIKPLFAVLFLECGVSKPHGPISQFVSLQSPNIAAAWDSRPLVLIEGNNYF